MGTIQYREIAREVIEDTEYKIDGRLYFEGTTTVYIEDEDTYFDIFYQVYAKEYDCSFSYEYYGTKVKSCTETVITDIVITGSDNEELDLEKLQNIIDYEIKV